MQKTVPDGTYTIQYYFNTYVPTGSAQVTVSGADVSNLQLHIAVITYTVSGKAVDANGNPLAGQTVTLKNPSNVGGYWSPTQADGSFSLNGIAPGSPVAVLPITVESSDLTGLVVR